MTTDTKTSQLVINRLTKTQFEGTTPNNTELWAVDPEFAGSKLLATDANGDIVESTINPSNVVQTSTLSDYVTTNTAQTISQSKAFSSSLVVADGVGLATGTILSNKKIIQKTSSGVEVGNSTEDVLLVGKSTTTRPKYNGNDLALLTDVGGGGLPSQTGNAGKFLTTDGTDASWGRVKTNDLFDFKWTDYQLNDQNWLRADTYSWQDGTVYSEAYNHLVDDIDGKTATTETIDGTTVTYYLADDGHKIVDVSDVSAIETVYSSTGVAWYYVLDTANQRFKLPRENPSKEVLAQSAPVVGDGSKFGLVNLNNNNEYNLVTFGTGAGYALALGSNSVNTNKIGISKDNTKSGVVADFSNISGVGKGKNYLYFYVGQFTQTATEQTAGLNASLFNGKADTDLNNVSAGIDFVVESYQNGTEWYRLYKSGWVEQGGNIPHYNSDQKITVSLPVTMANTNYFLSRDSINPSASGSTDPYWGGAYSLAVDSFDCYVSGSAGVYYRWEVKGMSAQS